MAPPPTLPSPTSAKTYPPPTPTSSSTHPPASLSSTAPRRSKSSSRAAPGVFWKETLTRSAPIKRIAAYAAIYLFWGASFLAIRVVVHAIPPFLAAGIRFFLAGLILVLYSLATRKPLPRGEQWRNLLILAITLFVGDYALLFWAEQKLPSGIAAVSAPPRSAQPDYSSASQASRRSSCPQASSPGSSHSTITPQSV
jgi:hypothetical protein